jgi:hypothetical protein
MILVIFIHLIKLITIPPLFNPCSILQLWYLILHGPPRLKNGFIALQLIDKAFNRIDAESKMREREECLRCCIIMNACSKRSD